ncbi:MAG: tetratricopeptide repeat protein [Cyclonatronaceae bacterium]
MYRKIIPLLILVLNALPAMALAQTSYGMPEVDARTYALWQAADWDGLISEGRSALRNGIDFYYLRYRLGVAWYEKGNYHLAIRHFEKAAAFDYSDITLKEYLYYANLFAGRRTEAAVVADGFPVSLQQKTGTEKGTGIWQFDLFLNLNSGAEKSVTGNYNPGAFVTDDGSQSISGGHRYISLGLQQQASSSFWLYHAYSGMIKQNFVYPVTAGVSSGRTKSTLYLNQYYLSGTWRSARNLELFAGFHYLNISYPAEQTVFRQGRSYMVSTRSYEHDYLLFAGIRRHFTGFTLSWSPQMSNLNNRVQYQQDLTAAIYPAGNLNLYFITTLVHQNGDLPGQSRADRLIAGQLAGARLLPFLWLEASATLGNMHNFTTHQGLVVYNNNETVTQRYGGSALFYIGNTWLLRIDYNRFNNESHFITISGTTDQADPISYYTHSLTFGLSWIF